jgi:hypothetical protein
VVAFVNDGFVAGAFSSDLNAIGRNVQPFEDIGMKIGVANAPAAGLLPPNQAVVIGLD